jgi:5-formyltetrahydrofolate cyclo-ligase
VDNTKSEIRKRIREARVNQSNRLAVSELFSVPEMKKANVIASYLSYGFEPDTSNINQEIIDSGRKLLLPRMLSDMSLEFIPWSGDKNALQTTGQIQEPVGEPFTGAIDVMILPALAIDKSGNRLGQGGGSFDRALLKFSGWSVALINQSELLENLPAEAHDKRVAAALTEIGLIRFNLN